MNRTCKLLAVALAGAALFSLDFHSRSSAATELNLGVEAFNKTECAEAIQHLEKAVSLDPENQCAHVYLATAYAKEYRPGVTTPENIHLAEQAIDQYQDVLDSNSNRTARIESAKSIANMYWKENKFEDSKKFYQMESDLDPRDPEPYFAIGRIDSIECYYHEREGLLPGEPRPTPSNKTDQNKACYELKARNGAPIREGIDSLNKGLKLRPHDQLAMEIMAELYSEKANIECDDPAANEEDRKMAGAWYKKKWFGIPVRTTKSTEPSSFLAFQNQLHGACQLSGESSGSGGTYDDAEAYQVYSAIIPIINPNPETRTWFIRIDTLPMGRGSFPPEDPSNPAREEGEQSREQRVADIALDDYGKMNAKTWLLQRNFTLPNPYRLVTPDEIEAMFPFNPEGVMEELWIGLSAVGFNADKTMAVVYMSHVCSTGDGCADGKSFLLQKHNGKWEVLSGVECWIS
jgi:tetratricopeptide (TPR) repeat protein